MRTATRAVTLNTIALDTSSWSIAAARQHGAVLLKPGHGETRRALIVSPGAMAVKQEVESVLAQPVIWQCVSQALLDSLLEREESTRMAAGAVQGITPTSEPTDHGVEVLSLQALDETDSPVIHAVNAAIYDAMRVGASDVHFESREDGLIVRYRIDGVMADGPHHSDPALGQQMVSRLKVMAQLDIGERRVPQDGRIVASALGQRIALRVSIMPSAYGEDAAVRILDKGHLSRGVQTLSMDTLGFDTSTQKSLSILAELPYGMLLVTGPTGSGKTTTLYALISAVYDGREKIVTIEDPIEYQLDGVLQIPVNERKGLTFARGLRSILRHDPDRIMVGEIRDTETAEIAIQSALTGHAVFTTVHANNVFDVVGRFTHMNVDVMNFVAALNGIVAQRLIRLICDECVQRVQPEQELLERSGITVTQDWRFSAGAGCPACRHTGYRGRMGIAEYVVFDDVLRDLLRRRVSNIELREAFEARGFESLRDKALDLVRLGRTTLEECNRVTVAQISH